MKDKCKGKSDVLPLIIFGRKVSTQQGENLRLSTVPWPSFQF